MLLVAGGQANMHATDKSRTTQLLEDGATAWRVLPESGNLPTDMRYKLASASLDNSVFVSGINEKLYWYFSCFNTS